MSRATRVLVTGAAGQVGVDLLDVLGGVVPPGGDRSFQPDGRAVPEGEFEVLGSHPSRTRRDRIVTRCMRAVEASRPDVIVHLAAYTAVDRAETEESACFAVNAAGTESMSLAAKEHGAHLIAISTDYVFDGNKGGAYVEDDATNPLNVYGASKRAGELLCSSDDTVVRTSWVMGVRGKNVAHVIAERALVGRDRAIRERPDRHRHRRERPGARRWRRSFVNVPAVSGTWRTPARPRGSTSRTTSERSSVAATDSPTAIATADLDPAPLATRPIRSDLSIEKFSSRVVGAPGVARRTHPVDP